MKFLADQDVFAGTIRFLRALDHDVQTAAERGMARATDVELLQAADGQQRVLVTRDRDFGGVVFVQGCGAGVIYLRALPTTVDAVHAELQRVLTLYTEEDLRKAFVVVEPGRHRMRRLAQDT